MTTVTTEFHAVIFDLGGVVFPSPFEAFDAYDRETGLAPGTVRSIIKTSSETGAWAALERGELTMPDFYSALESEATALGVVLGRNEPNIDISYAALSMLPNGVIAAAWADGRYRSPLNSYNYQVFGQAITPAGTPLWDDSERQTRRPATLPRPTLCLVK